MPYLNFANAISQELLKKIPKNVKFELHKTHAEFDFNSLAITKPNCIFFHRDILCTEEFDHSHQTITNGAQRYLNIVDQNPETNFVLMYGSQQAERELKHDRLHLVRYTSGLAQQKEEYQNLNPASVKNFGSKKNFICLNRHPRQHRVNLVSYLLGQNFEQHGTISFRDQHVQATDWLDRVSWQLTEYQSAQIKPILQQGFAKTKLLNLTNDISTVDELYIQHTNNNATNFDLHLRNIYNNHFVEIVSETLFNTPTIGVSEKFLNSVYGCVFPIVIGGQGIVKCLKDMGFDMFDDIVNQSYDTIADPLDRLCAAVDLNQPLLTDNIAIKQLWQANQHRFDNNIKFATMDIYNIIKQQAHVDFDRVKWKI